MMKKEQDILITVIKNLIEAGIEYEIMFKEKNKHALESCRRKYDFLNRFWNEHKKEFIDAGFEEDDEGHDYYPYKHPLHNAYNIVSIEKNSIMKDLKEIQKTYVVCGVSTTGDLSYDQLSKCSGLSVYSVKNLIKKLEFENIIGKVMLDGLSCYNYYIKD